MIIIILNKMIIKRNQKYLCILIFNFIYDYTLKIFDINKKKNLLFLIFHIIKIFLFSSNYFNNYYLYYFIILLSNIIQIILFILSNYTYSFSLIKIY